MVSAEHNSPPTYYEASSNRGSGFPRLHGAVTTDVCVIGGGIAGCSTALELAERGYRVVLLESHTIGAGASGRNGGQVIPGFAAEQSKIAALVGAADAKRLWQISVEAVQLVRERIRRHAIICDWRDGHMQVASNLRQRDLLNKWHEELETALDYTSTRILNREETQALVATKRYCAGLYDANGGHLHPLNYTLGLANAAHKAGAMIFERSPVISFRADKTIAITTSEGIVNASFAVLATNCDIGNLAPSIRHRIMPVRTYMIATEPLGHYASELIRNNSAVMDSNFILDYFRRSADDRLLFGGRVSYSGRDTFHSMRATHVRMSRVFPQLADAKIDFTWSGLLDITMNRAPDFGRAQPNVYYLQGFSGHGIALATLAGQMTAQTIAGQSERFDLFGKIKHRDFPGGKLLRTPALVLAMMWYRLRDLL